MPTRPPSPCSTPGCGKLARSRYCDGHTQTEQRAYERSRGSASGRGYNARWRRARLAYLGEHPLCVSCDVRGAVRAATVVDHVVPHRGDQERFWDANNWQPLCKPCHDSKTARTDGRWG